MSDLAVWIREATQRRRERLYWQGYWEGFNQAAADARAGLPKLTPGSEFNSLCRLGLTYGNPAYEEPQPTRRSSSGRQGQAAQHGPL